MRETKQRGVVLIASLILLLLVASACSGTGGNETGSASAPAASDSSGIAESDSPGETSRKAGDGKAAVIEVTAWGDPAVQKVFEKSFKQFNEENKGEVTASLQIIPTDYDTKLTTMIAGNEAPDIAQMESASLAFPLADEGKFLDLMPFLEADEELALEDLAPLHGYYSDKGELIGLNSERESFMVFYNVDMFKEAGVEKPSADPGHSWDWDAFVEAAKKLTFDQNGNNAASPNFDSTKIKQYGVDFGKWWGLWGNFVFSNGGDFVSQDGTEFGLSKPEATEALQKLADLINVHHVAPSPAQAKSLPGGVNSVKTKKVAMLLDGQWMNLQFGNAEMNYDVAPLPKHKETVTMIVSGMFSIFKSTDNPDAAWKVLKSMVDPESVFDLLHDGVWLPPHRDWYSDPDKVKRWTDNQYHTEGFGGTLETVLNHSVPTPTAYVKNFSKMMDLVNPALDKVWTGEQTAEEAMRAIEPKVLEVGIGRREVKM